MIPASTSTSVATVALCILLVIGVSAGTCIYIFNAANLPEFIGNSIDLLQRENVVDAVDGEIRERGDNMEHAQTTSHEPPAGSKTAMKHKGFPDGYTKSPITNQADMAIIGDLDEAEHLLEERLFNDALEKFDQILHTHKASPRATYGRARTLAAMAEKDQNASMLEQSIFALQGVLDLKEVPKVLMLKAAKECVVLMKSRGWVQKAKEVIQRMETMYREDASTGKNTGMQSTKREGNKKAKTTSEEVLKPQPHNGIRLAEMGSKIYMSGKDYQKSADLLQRGIDTQDPGTSVGKYFAFLGNAYQRIGEPEKALQIHELGAERGIFLSTHQRSRHNVDRLKGKPWWTIEETGYSEHFKEVQKHWKTIRDEGLALLESNPKYFVKSHQTDLYEGGYWKQLFLYKRGERVDENCARAPKTCALFQNFIAATSCSRGQVKFSLLQPGLHIIPHCGPTNCRIRAHLGLVVPEGPRIRVVDEIRTWKEGEYMLFDDSFEHEVWHNGTSIRLNLMIDVWHPELTAEERKTLSPV